MKKTLIIIEAGVNHSGDLNLAKKLIEIAADPGADFVKFQSSKAENCISTKAEKAPYQLKTTASDESQLQIVQKLELDLEAHKELISYTKKYNIAFLSTPFDLEGADLLNELGLKISKILSGEITNLPYLKKIAKLNKKIILSTGMANLGEIEEALNALCKDGIKRQNITLLHCIIEYPAPFDEVNLKAAQGLKNAFKFDVGYSDHTQGIHISLAAVALGACVIERHFTLDKNMSGPDHKVSLEPHELKTLCTQIRQTQKAMGDGTKKASKGKRKNINVVGESLIAKKDIQKGEIFNEENLTIKRPANGISTMRYEESLDKITTKNYKEGKLICE